MLVVAVLLGLASGVGLAAGEATVAQSPWRELAPGVELRTLEARPPREGADSGITVVRVDPASWQLELVSVDKASETAGRSARDWARKGELAIASNAGMFLEDYTTHVGYVERKGQVLSARINSYQSIAAFDPHDGAAVPPFRIFDLDEPGVTVESIRADYGSLVQNLRLIKRPGVNRWSQQEKRWAEAALGEDDAGRMLFIFSREALSMHDLIARLLAAGIGIVAAQHLEGGRLAQLYVKAGGVELELFDGAGSASAWPIPNVLGVTRRSAAKQATQR
jgi:uncharacterized protein YigE (DUF2233 family)